MNEPLIISESAKEGAELFRLRMPKHHRWEKDSDISEYLERLFQDYADLEKEKSVAELKEKVDLYETHLPSFKDWIRQRDELKRQNAELQARIAKLDGLVVDGSLLRHLDDQAEELITLRAKNSELVKALEEESGLLDFLSNKIGLDVREHTRKEMAKALASTQERKI